MARRALITGITGQDGSYLAETLLAKGYEVHGLIRRTSTDNLDRIRHLMEDSAIERNLVIHYGDMCDPSSLSRVVEKAEPDEVYNLAAQSDVGVSFRVPEYTMEVNLVGTIHLLEAVRTMQDRLGRQIRVYQAGTSEMFGRSHYPQNETTPFRPCSPYAVSKAAAHSVCCTYRESYGMYICNGILFNHESPRRGEGFVTRKITRAVGRIVVGTQHTLWLGNLSACRDWGYAPEYVLAMWLIMQRNTPEDYVISTDECHSVQDFLEEAFEYVNLDWRRYVRQDTSLFRPLDVEYLQGDCQKARRELGWKPEVSFRDLVHLMVDHDVALARREATLIRQGSASGATGQV